MIRIAMAGNCPCSCILLHGSCFRHSDSPTLTEIQLMIPPLNLIESDIIVEHLHIDTKIQLSSRQSLPSLPLTLIPRLKLPRFAHPDRRLPILTPTLHQL